MLEIIILIFLTRRLKGLAAQKGRTPWKWAALGVLSWFAGELLGVMILIGFLGLPQKTYFILYTLFGIGLGYLFFLLVRQNLENKPDIEEL